MQLGIVVVVVVFIACLRTCIQGSLMNATPTFAPKDLKKATLMNILIVTHLRRQKSVDAQTGDLLHDEYSSMRPTTNLNFRIWQALLIFDPHTRVAKVVSKVI